MSVHYAVFVGSLAEGFRIAAIEGGADRAESAVVARLADGQLAERVEVYKPSSLDGRNEDHEEGDLYVGFTSGLSGGLSLYGPFPGHGLANEFAEANRDDGEEWEVFEALSGAEAEKRTDRAQGGMEPVPELQVPAAGEDAKPEEATSDRLRYFDVAIGHGAMAAPLGHWRGIAASAEKAKSLAREAHWPFGKHVQPTFRVNSKRLADSNVGRIWWCADNMEEALKWRRDMQAKGAHVVLDPEKDRPIVDVLITLERGRAAEILGMEPGAEEWLDDSSDHEPTVSQVFVAAMLDLADINALFQRGEVSSVQHGREREAGLSSALGAMAREYGVLLQAPLQISSRGEFAINVVDGAGGYGEAFAELLNRHNPRCGAGPGAVLVSSNSWCWMNHFNVEKMVGEHLERHADRSSDQSAEQPRGDRPRA